MYKVRHRLGKAKSPPLKSVWGETVNIQMKLSQISNVKEDEGSARVEAPGKATCYHIDGLSLNPVTHRRCVCLYPFYFETSIRTFWRNTIQYIQKCKILEDRPLSLA